MENVLAQKKQDHRSVSNGQLSETIRFSLVRNNTGVKNE